MYQNTLLNKQTETVLESMASRRESAHSQRKAKSRDLLESDSVGPYDVMCGRQSASFNNMGNIRFRGTVETQLGLYAHPNTTRKEKSAIVRSIVSTVRMQGGRFIKWDESEKKWRVLDDRQARAKAGHCIRDMASARSDFPLPQPIVNSSVEGQYTVVKAISSALHQPNDFAMEPKKVSNNKMSPTESIKCKSELPQKRPDVDCQLDSRLGVECKDLSESKNFISMMIFSVVIINGE